MQDKRLAVHMQREDLDLLQRLRVTKTVNAVDFCPNLALSKEPVEVVYSQMYLYITMQKFTDFIDADETGSRPVNV